MTNQDALAALKKNPIGFGCGFVSLLLALMIYLRSEEIPGAEAELALRAADRDRVTLNIKYSAQLKEQADFMAGTVREIESHLIRPSQLGANTQYFYNVERETGVKIIDLRQTGSTATVSAPAAQVAARAPKVTFAPVPFSVSVQGSLSQIIDFVRQLENGSHYCRVLTASVSKTGVAKNTLLTLTLSLELFGQP